MLQRKVGKALLQRLEVVDNYGAVLDLGCGTGFISDEFLRQKLCAPEQIIALDIAESMLRMARAKLINKGLTAYLCADAECLPLLPQSVDLVVSNLAFQWCSNLEKAFVDIKRILKPEGRLLFTTFGSRTLHELKSAWREVDGYTHVNDFYSAEQVAELLQHAGFQQIEIDAHSYLSTYETVWDLMVELKQLGAHTVMAGGNKRFTGKAAMQRMINAYQKQDKNGLIPATFEVITVVAKV
jgi:malonyl-CoA O-methyltransferase